MHKLTLQKFISELLNGECRRLCRVFRYNSTPVLRTENVAEHSWYVAYICLMMWFRLRDSGVELDRGKLLSKAILHDLDEMLTGDIPRPFKHHSEQTKTLLNSAAESLFRDWADRFHLPNELWSEWKYSKEGPEGLVIKFADFATAVSYITEEVLMGNKLLLIKSGEVGRYLRQFQTLLNDIIQGDSECDLYLRTAVKLLPYVTVLLNMIDEGIESDKYSLCRT